MEGCEEWKEKEPAIIEKNFCTYLVADGFFRWEIERVDLWELRPQVIVQCPELSIAPVHIPLIVQNSNVHLKR